MSWGYCGTDVPGVDTDPGYEARSWHERAAEEYAANARARLQEIERSLLADPRQIESDGFCPVLAEFGTGCDWLPAQPVTTFSEHDFEKNARIVERIQKAIDDLPLYGEVYNRQGDAAEMRRYLALCLEYGVEFDDPKFQEVFDRAEDLILERGLMRAAKRRAWQFYEQRNPTAAAEAACEKVADAQPFNSPFAGLAALLKK